jgi:hypothetical protein
VGEWWTITGNDTDYAVNSSNNAIAGYALTTFAQDQQYDLTLQNLSNINPAGMTGIRLHVSGTSAAAPVGANNVNIVSYNHISMGGGVPEADRRLPKLVVTHTSPSIQRLAPDAILAQTNLTGAVTAIQDDPDSADSNWLVSP